MGDGSNDLVSEAELNAAAEALGWPQDPHARGQALVALVAAARARPASPANQPRVGDVLDAASPEPPDGAPLLGPNSTVERYISGEVGGAWRRYVGMMGPFVVAPDYDDLVNGA